MNQKLLLGFPVIYVDCSDPLHSQDVKLGIMNRYGSTLDSHTGEIVSISPFEQSLRDGGYTQDRDGIYWNRLDIHTEPDS